MVWPGLYRTINQYGGNPDTMGCVWTGEIDLNMLSVDGEILKPERKSCGFKNIRIRVSGRGAVEKSFYI